MTKSRRLPGWKYQLVTNALVRKTLMVQALPSKLISSVEVRRITLLPNVKSGAHVHNGPVFGLIESGSVIFQVGLASPQTLTAGDVVYEPAADTASRWDATKDGVTFVGSFLLGDNESLELTPVP